MDPDSTKNISLQYTLQLINAEKQNSGEEYIPVQQGKDLGKVKKFSTQNLSI